MDLDSIGRDLRASLDAKNAARERALPLCRSAVRSSANAIRAVHRGDEEGTERNLSEARRCLDEARTALAGHPDVHYAGFFHDAAKEYGEARLTQAVVRGLPLPGPAELGLEAPAYLNGFGEAIGELRRHVLDLLRRGELDRSEELLGVMEEIHDLLMSMDYPEAVTAGLRRTSDAMRAIVERTRGDLTTTVIQRQLQAALETRAAAVDLP
ncbi:MAG TPA: haloacid dehalogenase [Actinomycetota bacterium]|nr:haloacid dehalogenase [Actinomycetota bacterium]